MELGVTKMKEIKAMKEWPQIGDRYYWTTIYGSLQDKIFEGNPDEKTLISNGNVYRTKQGALDAVRAQKLIAAVARRRKELNGDWVPVDENKDFDGYCIVYYEGDYITFNSAYLNVTGATFGIYKDRECVRTIIEEFQDELKWYFTEYIVSVN